MIIFLIILLIVVCLALVFIVLVQNPKGGGLVSEFSSANQIIGVQKSTDTVEKITWGLASALLVLCLATTWLGGSLQNQDPAERKSLIQDKIINIPSNPNPINQQPPANGGGNVPNQEPSPNK